ncbi:MAG: uridine kinase [Nocardioides sp.]|jgi:uridine kinase
MTVLGHVADQLGYPSRPLLVAIDGPDGAGKTWFADALARLLIERSYDVVRASVDDFHHPRAFRHGAGRTAETVWERSYDYRALRTELLDPWLTGPGSAFRHRFHDLDGDGYFDDPAQQVPERGVLVLDGVFAQRRELSNAWDFVVYLDVPESETVSRMANRDGVPDDPAHPDQARYLGAQRLYRAHVDPVRYADVVIDNSDFHAPKLIGATASMCPTCGHVTS